MRTQNIIHYALQYTNVLKVFTYQPPVIWTPWHQKWCGIGVILWTFGTVVQILIDVASEVEDGSEVEDVGYNASITEDISNCFMEIEAEEFEGM